MSTLNVANTNTTNLNNTDADAGRVKASINFNGTGTVAINGSLNVSGLVDNGTGDYTINFTNSFGAADYSPACTGHDEGAGNSGVILQPKSGVTLVVGSLRVTSSRSTGFGLGDLQKNYAVVTGDLA